MNKPAVGRVRIFSIRLGFSSEADNRTSAGPCSASGPAKVTKKPSCPATTLHRSVALPFVISTGPEFPATLRWTLPRVLLSGKRSAVERSAVPLRVLNGTRNPDHPRLRPNPCSPNRPRSPMKSAVVLRKPDKSPQVSHYKPYTSAQASPVGFPVEIILDNRGLSRSSFAPLSYLDKRLLNRFLALAKAGLKDLGLVPLLRRIA
jgi:hypothetical protein